MTRILIAMLAMGAVTLLCRATPFLFFMRRRPPAVLDYLQKYIPPVVMTLLVLNALKGIRPLQSPHGLPELASTAFVAGLQLWKRNVLVSIVGGTALYMLLIRMV